MEGDAGATRLNPAGQGGADVPVAAPDTTEEGVSRLRGRGVIGACAVLVLLAAGVATGGYLVLRSHHESQAVARDDAAAIEAAKDCVAATQAPDVDALPAAQQKISECSTDVFATQAAVYSGVLVQAYQAANVHIQLSDMRTAVERNYDDGSVDLLVALRVKVDNAAAQGQQYGYRLRVKMARDDDQYKIAKLDQVAG
jgi:Mce-associated membrane protein